MCTQVLYFDQGHCGHWTSVAVANWSVIPECTTFNGLWQLKIRLGDESEKQECMFPGIFHRFLDSWQCDNVQNTFLIQISTVDIHWRKFERYDVCMVNIVANQVHTFIGAVYLHSYGPPA